MELAEQTALITGGTAGIGLACAELLAREGASVISTGRDEQRGKSAAAGIDGRVRFVQADLSDIESVESLIRTWAAEFGARGVRVNSVAPAPPKPKAWKRSGAKATRNSAVRCRWAAPPNPKRSRMRCSFSPHPGKLHHRFNPARRWRRQHHLKHTRRNDRCRKSMTPNGRTR